MNIGQYLLEIEKNEKLIIFYFKTHHFLM